MSCVNKKKILQFNYCSSPWRRDVVFKYKLTINNTNTRVGVCQIKYNSYCFKKYTRDRSS